MDNNPNQPNQLDQDDPVFSSSDLTQTKARKDTHFFTNVQKATLGQKISEWFNKLNRESLEHSAARKAAFKAKLEERRRAADLAAISAAVPNAPVPTRPATSAPAPTAPPANVPTQPTPTPAAPVVPAPAPAAPAPATLVSAPAPIAPATTPNQQPTIIIEDTPQPPRKSRRTLLIAIATIVILLLALIITLLVLKPWQPSTPTTPVVETVMSRYDLYEELGPAGVDEYYAEELADATDEQARIAILAQKIAFYSTVFDLDAALDVLAEVDIDAATPVDLYTIYMSMNTIYTRAEDEATATEYYNKAMAIPGMEEYKNGGGV